MSGGPLFLPRRPRRWYHRFVRPRPRPVRAKHRRPWQFIPPTLSELIPLALLIVVWVLAIYIAIVLIVTIALDRPPSSRPDDLYSLAITTIGPTHA